MKQNRKLEKIEIHPICILNSIERVYQRLLAEKKMVCMVNIILKNPKS